MRISTNTLFEQSVNSILNNQSEMLKTQQQVSTGKRILTPADDPAGAAQLVTLNQIDAQNTQFKANRQTASNSLSLQDTTLAQVTNILQNVNTLTVSANNGTLNDADRATIAQQLSSNLTELTGLANAVDGQGHYLFAGFQSQTQPFTAGPAGVQYNGDNGQQLIQVDNATQMAVNTSGVNVFMNIPGGNGYFVTAAAAGNTGSGLIDPGSVTNPANLTGDNYAIKFTASGGPVTYDVVDTTTNASVLSGQPYSSGDAIRFDGMNITIQGSPANGDSFNISPSRSQSIFTTLQNLINVLNTPSTAAGTTALTNGINQGQTDLNQALNNVLIQRGIIGGKLNQIDSLNTVGDNRSVQYKQSESRLSDVDLNAAVSQLSQQQLNLQAAQQSFAKVSGLSLFNYLQ